MVEILSSIAVRDKKQVLILRTWKRTVISELRFMPSFWGHEYRYQSDKMSLWIIHSSGASTHLKSQILRLCSQRKRLGESREFQWVVLIHWFFPFPLCPKSLKDRFLRPEFTESSLKKVAKNGKIEASQKKEVLRWRRKKKSMRVNIYSHITDTMQRQAAVKIDREIGGTDAQMPEPELPKASEQAQTNATAEPKFEPYKGKIRNKEFGDRHMFGELLQTNEYNEKRAPNNGQPSKIAPEEAKNRRIAWKVHRNMI